MAAKFLSMSVIAVMNSTSKYIFFSYKKHFHRNVETKINPDFKIMLNIPRLKVS